MRRSNLTRARLKSTVLGKAHQTLGRSDLVAFAALKLRNQFGTIVARHLTTSVRMDENGEADVVKAFAPACATFVDVGAHNGTWSELFLEANPEARGILIEPEDGKIQRHFPPHLLERIQIVAAAAGASAGEAPLFTNPDKCASLLTEPDRTPTMHVPVVTVTEIARRYDLETVDFLKIDVEGTEFDVLLGCQPLIDEQRIGVIQFEYGDLWAIAGHTLTHARAWLESKGFRIFIAAPGGLRTPRWERYGEFTWYANVVAVSERSAAIATSINQGPV